MSGTLLGKLLLQEYHAGLASRQYYADFQRPHLEMDTARSRHDFPSLGDAGNKKAPS